MNFDGSRISGCEQDVACEVRQNAGDEVNWSKGAVRDSGVSVMRCVCDEL